MSDTLTIKDNRTGKEYEVDIVDGNISAMQLRQIKINEGDFGVMSYDPGYLNTASCTSRITDLHGSEGILRCRWNKGITSSPVSKPHGVPISVTLSQ